MGEPYLGEIRVASFNFAPKGWALCNGQLLPINQNQALFSILGTTYGGDGRVTFALPDLRARIPFHMGNGMTLGERGGETSHTLTLAELPQHTHLGNAQSTPGTPGTSPNGTLPGPGPAAMYAPTPNASMRTGSVSSVGGNQPHANEAPYLVLTMIIALQGIFPSQN